MKAVIIEDEERNRIVLQSLIETYCSEVEIIGHADSVRTGVQLVRSKNPQLIFMDVQLIGGTGFDILNKLEDYAGGLIFTTAYDQYAVKAFKFSAIDYLLKPIDVDELKNAVRRALEVDKMNINRYKFQNLISNLKKPEGEDPVLLVSTLDTIEFVRMEDIVRVEAQGAYSEVYKKDNTKIMVSKVIKEFEYLLNDHGFYRVHQSHILNLSCIKKYIKSDHCLELRDGMKIQLARSRKEQFFEVMKKMQG